MRIGSRSLGVFRLSLRGRFAKFACGSLYGVFAALCIASTAKATSFYDEPVGLRLLLTLDRQSNYAATLGRQASVAFLGGGSVNPGANGWARRPGQPPTGIATYVDAPSAGGRRVAAVPVTAQWSLPEGGSMLAAYAYTDTPESTGDNGLGYLLRSNEWTLGFGTQIDTGMRAGATVRFVDGKFASESYAPALLGQVVGADTRLHGPDIALGLARRLSPAVTAGVVGAVGLTSTTTAITLPRNTVVPVPGVPGGVVLPSGTILDSFSDPVRSFALRGGLGFQPDASIGFYGDVTFNAVDSQRFGSLQIGRVAIGIEYLPREDWALRAGASIDTESQVQLSIGLGFHVGPDAEVQLAFQTNAAPELNPEFGRTRLLGASIAFHW